MTLKDSLETFQELGPFIQKEHSQESITGTILDHYTSLPPLNGCHAYAGQFASSHLR